MANELMTLEQLHRLRQSDHWLSMTMHLTRARRNLAAFMRECTPDAQQALMTCIDPDLAERMTPADFLAEMDAELLARQAETIAELDELPITPHNFDEIYGLLCRLPEEARRRWEWGKRAALKIAANTVPGDSTIARSTAYQQERALNTFELLQRQDFVDFDGRDTETHRKVKSIVTELARLLPRLENPLDITHWYGAVSRLPVADALWVIRYAVDHPGARVEFYEDEWEIGWYRLEDPDGSVVTLIDTGYEDDHSPVGARLVEPEFEDDEEEEDGDRPDSGQLEVCEDDDTDDIDEAGDRPDSGQLEVCEIAAVA